MRDEYPNMISWLCERRLKGSLNLMVYSSYRCFSGKQEQGLFYQYGWLPDYSINWKVVDRGF
jgi:hypothetical protein